MPTTGRQRAARRRRGRREAAAVGRERDRRRGRRRPGSAAPAIGEDVRVIDRTRRSVPSWSGRQPWRAAMSASVAGQDRVRDRPPGSRRCGSRRPARGAATAGRLVKPAPGPRGPRHRRPATASGPTTAKSGPTRAGRRVDALVGRDVDVAHARAPRRSTGTACRATVSSRSAAARAIASRVRPARADRVGQPRRVAGLVVVGQHDRRPAVGAEGPLAAADGGPEGGRRPGPGEELPVEHEVAVARQRGRALGRARRTARRPSSARVGVDDRPEPLRASAGRSGWSKS